MYINYLDLWHKYGITIYNVLETMEQTVIIKQGYRKTKISFQSWRMATINPVETLRYE